MPTGGVGARGIARFGRCTTLALGILGCAGGAETAPSSVIGWRIGPASATGAALAGAVNSDVAIGAMVTDQNRAPVRGYQVTFTVQAGGGSFQPRGQRQFQIMTGQDGIATATWKLGPVVGDNNNSATASGPGFAGQPLDGSPVTYLASGRGDPMSFVEISAGGLHTCGRVASGAVSCWGLGDRGQLGDGTGEWRVTPTVVSGNLSFAEITAGMQHTCGRVTSGAVYCWGMNAYGQLGDGTTADKWIPTIVR